MNRIMLKSKIHRAIVTDANIDYEGSITLDEALMESAGILPYEQVDIYNIRNGSRFHTYAIPGERDTGMVCINGAAARLAVKGDIIIIASYTILDNEAAAGHAPVLIHVDRNNRIARLAGGFHAR